MGLFFGKNEVKTLSELQEHNGDLYTSLMEEARGSLNASSEEDELDTRSEREIELEAKVETLEAADSERMETEKIASYASKLGVEVPESEEKMSFSDALVSMVDSMEEKAENLKDAFEETASVPAGVSNENGDDDEPKTFVAAIRMIAERDDISKTEASQKAKVEFKKLLNKQY